MVRYTDIYTEKYLKHPRRPTKLAWGPATSRRGALASSGNTLRVWHFNDDDGAVRHHQTLTNWRNQHQSTPPPLTSLDWSPVSADGDLQPKYSCTWITVILIITH